jgi:hypothetical protein
VSPPEGDGTSSFIVQRSRLAGTEDSGHAAATVSFALDVPDLFAAWDEAGAAGSLEGALRNAWLTLRQSPLSANALPSGPDDGDADSKPIQMLQDPVRVGSVALTAGFVWWLTRGGGLLTSLLMGAPAWRHVDLLPVLARDAEDDDDAEPAATGKARHKAEGAPDSTFDDSAVAELLTHSHRDLEPHR